MYGFQNAHYDYAFENIHGCILPNIKNGKKYANIFGDFTFLLWMILGILITGSYFRDDIWRESIQSSLYSHHNL